MAAYIITMQWILILSISLNVTKTYTLRNDLEKQSKLSTKLLEKVIALMNYSDGNVLNTINPYEFMHSLVQIEMIKKAVAIYEPTEKNLAIIDIVLKNCIACLGLDQTTIFRVSNYTDLETRLLGLFKRINQKDQLYFIVFGSYEFIRSLLKLVQVVDGMLNQQGYFIFLHKWILTCSYDDINRIEKHIDRINNVIAVVDDHQTNQINIFTAIWSGRTKTRGMKRTFTFVGYYNNIESLVIIDDTLFPNYKYGFNGQHFYIGTQLWPGYVELKSSGNTTHFYGSYVDVADYISVKLNFTYNFVLPSDGMWGAKVNGKWNGILKLVDERKVDFVISALVVSFLRAEAMDFADFPMHYEYSTGVFKKPEPIENSIELYAKPFSLDSWIAIVVIIILNGLALSGCSIIHYNIHIKNNKVNQRDGELSLQKLTVKSFVNNSLKIYFAMFQAFFGQGVNNLIPSKGPARLLWQGYWLFSVFITSLWAGKYISFIAVKIYPLPFKTLEDLPYQNTYKVGTIGLSNYHTLLMTSENSQYIKLWDTIISSNKTDPDILSSNHSVHLDKVLSGQYVYLIDEISAEKLKSKHCDVIDIIDDQLFYDYYAIGMQKNSAYKPLMNHVTLELYDNAILDRLLRYYVLNSRGGCSANNKGNSDPIRLQLRHIYSILYSTLVFLAIATVILFLEKIYYWFYIYLTIRAKKDKKGL